MAALLRSLGYKDFGSCTHLEEDDIIGKVGRYLRLGSRKQVFDTIHGPLVAGREPQSPHRVVWVWVVEREPCRHRDG